MQSAHSRSKMKLQLILPLLFVASVYCDGLDFLNGSGRANSTNGRRQSPINLTTVDAIPAMNMPPLQFMVYQEDPTQVTVTNNGYTAVYRFQYANGQNVTAQGGPLRGAYQMDSLHFHWGANSSVGSEHFIDGIQYAMEMHIVCFRQQYGSVEEAQTQSNGLFVLGVMFTRRGNTNPDYGWIPALNEVQAAGTSYTLPDPTVFNIKRLIGARRTPYFFYPGSLTTPPYYENVEWVVQRRPLPISEAQLDTFRSLRKENGEPLVDNFRPTQPTNNRPIFLYQ